MLNYFVPGESVTYTEVSDHGRLIKYEATVIHRDSILLRYLIRVHSDKENDIRTVSDGSLSNPGEI